MRERRRGRGRGRGRSPSLKPRLRLRPSARQNCNRNSSRSRGFGAIAAIVVLVVLAALAAAIVRIGGGAQVALAQDFNAARAWQAARAGTEWGIYQALKGSWTSCSNQSQTLDLRADTGMRVAVSCDSTLYNEGQASPGVAQTRRVYTVIALACNGAVCPDAALAVQPGYVERRRLVQVVQ